MACQHCEKAPSEYARCAVRGCSVPAKTCSGKCGVLFHLKNGHPPGDPCIVCGRSVASGTWVCGVEGCTIEFSGGLDCGAIKAHEAHVATDPMHGRSSPDFRV